MLAAAPRRGERERSGWRRCRARRQRAARQQLLEHASTPAGERAGRHRETSLSAPPAWRDSEQGGSVCADAAACACVVLFAAQPNLMMPNSMTSARRAHEISSLGRWIDRRQRRLSVRPRRVVAGRFDAAAAAAVAPERDGGHHPPLAYGDTDAAEARCWAELAPRCFVESFRCVRRCRRGVLNSVPHPRQLRLLHCARSPAVRRGATRLRQCADAAHRPSPTPSRRGSRSTTARRRSRGAKRLVEGVGGGSTTCGSVCDGLTGKS